MPRGIHYDKIDTYCGGGGGRLDKTPGLFESGKAVLQASLKPEEQF
jgi:hypothetical protein